MRFGIFYEHQLPRPWTPTSEADLMRDALDQIELADRLGFDYVWVVEHHFLEEYSHCSAPEVFLAAASQRTKQIRLGHGIVNVMPKVNHPARVAERIATLDLVSNGRVDFGTGESSSAAELGGFLVDRAQKRDLWHESIDHITRMFVEEPYAGSDWMPPRNVLPKPMQKPHPPMWAACSQRESIRLAAQCGLGALSYRFAEPEDAAEWVAEYYSIIESDECMPAAFSVNPALAVVMPMMLSNDEDTAVQRGIDGARFFSYSLGHYYGPTPHTVGVTNVWESFLAHKASDGAAAGGGAVKAEGTPLGGKMATQGSKSSLRGAVGTPEQVSDLVRRHEAAGVDQIIFVPQAGNNTHEHICESLELFAAEVMPEFAEGREAKEAEKAARLAGPIEAALARREPARTMDEPYVIDEQAEVGQAAPS